MDSVVTALIALSVVILTASVLFFAMLLSITERLNSLINLFVEQRNTGYNWRIMSRSLNVYYYKVVESADTPPEKTYHVVKPPYVHRLFRISDLLHSNAVIEHVYMNIHNTPMSVRVLGTFVKSNQLQNILLGYTDKVYFELDDKTFEYMRNRLSNQELMAMSVTKTSPV